MESLRVFSPVQHKFDLHTSRMKAMSGVLPEYISLEQPKLNLANRYCSTCRPRSRHRLVMRKKQSKPRLKLGTQPSRAAKDAVTTKDRDKQLHRCYLSTAYTAFSRILVSTPVASTQPALLTDSQQTAGNARAYLMHTKTQALIALKALGRHKGST